MKVNQINKSKSVTIAKTVKSLDGISFYPAICPFSCILRSAICVPRHINCALDFGPTLERDQLNLTIVIDGPNSER
jgi:hypothetical protein